MCEGAPSDKLSLHAISIPVVARSVVSASSKIKQWKYDF